VLLKDIPAGAVPVINVGDDQTVLVEFQFAPARNLDRGFPGEGGGPVEGPVGADVVVGALDLVQVEAGIMKPGFDEADHFLVAIAPPKLGHWIFEIDVFRIKTKGLMVRKIFVILFERFEDVHCSGKSRAVFFVVES